MRILLDECLPRELAAELTGHEVRTVRQQGWPGIGNGELLRTAAGAFDVFLTVDKRIEHAEKLPGNLAVVTIRARSNRIQSLRPLVSEIIDVLNGIRPGTSARVGSAPKGRNPTAN